MIGSGFWWFAFGGWLGAMLGIFLAGLLAAAHATSEEERVERLERTNERYRKTIQRLVDERACG